jgi:VIT1/CCC1 family predicted Fe2+/Mn2+ transporter
MLRVVEEHLDSNQVSRVIYGAIIGLALIVALEHEQPRPGVMAGTLVGTGVAVGLAELYSEVVGTEVRTRRRVERKRLREIAAGVVAVAFGVSFPAIFFLLSVAGAMQTETAFEAAKWSGLALTGFYGFCAARLSGARLWLALTQAAAVTLIGAFLIGLKALVH